MELNTNTQKHMDIMGKSATMLAAAMMLAGMTACNGNSEQKEEAQINAEVLASLGDLMQGDYNDVISRINNSGRFSRDDIFGNNHEFTSAERALNYIASVNNATFFVMDSLQLTIEAAAAENSGDMMLDKLNKLAKKYIDVCKHPADSPKQLIETCRSISTAIKKTTSSMGKTDEEAVKTQTALAGNIIMQKELAAAQKASEANSAAAERNRIEGENFLKENARKPGVKTLDDGLQYRIIKNGSGISPNNASTVVVEYEGKFTDGTVFDGTAKNNKGKPVTLGVSSVMRGWSEALKLMKKGSEWEIYVPYELGYGEQGEGNVPPFSVLVFRLKLVDVK